MKILAEINGMKILKAHWFSQAPDICFGIVKTENESEEIKYYIGVASGLDEREDEKMIALTGQKISKEKVTEFFKDE